MSSFDFDNHKKRAEDYYPHPDDLAQPPLTIEDWGRRNARATFRRLSQEEMMQRHNVLIEGMRDAYWRGFIFGATVFSVMWILVCFMILRQVR